jgi:hypothetical protein
MRDTFAAIERDETERKSRVVARMESRARSAEIVTAEAVNAAAKAAFDPHNRQSEIQVYDVITTCAALVTFMNYIEAYGARGTISEWRERIETLRISLKD